MFPSLDRASPSAGSLRRPYVPRWLVHVSAVVVVVVASSAPTGLGHRMFESVVAALITGSCVVAILLREAYPITVQFVVLVLYCLGLALDGPVVGVLAALLISTYALSKFTDRRYAVIGALGTSVIASAASLYFLPVDRFGDGVVQVIALIGFATAAGDASRSGKAYLESMIERARAAEETKEAEADRRVSEERLRIARDLHDALAHQIAVINMHANVATQALPDRPDDCEAALVTIRHAARTVLGEMGSLLSVLRASDTPETGLVSAPVAGMSELNRMIDSFQQHGLRVALRTTGDPMQLSGAADIVAYRIVQEGLTNALKHGADGSALLSIDTDRQGVEITVTNTVAGAQRTHQTSGGHGLMGASERLASVGGTLVTRPGPVYRFTAWLPLADVDEGFR